MSTLRWGEVLLDIDSLAQQWATMPMASEAEVRSKVAVPLLDLLGYPAEHRAEEWPVYGWDGRRRLATKHADFVLFDSAEYESHRTAEKRGWAQDHSLLVLETKDREESIEGALGQAQFYSMWLKTPCYILTNGVDIAVYRLNPLSQDEKVLECRLEDLPKHWWKVQQMLSPEAVAAYLERNALKLLAPDTSKYGDYAKTLYLGLEEGIRGSLDRTVSDYFGLSALETSPSLTPLGDAEHGEVRPTLSYTQLLEDPTPVIVLAGPGEGKSYLCEMLAAEALRRHLEDENAPLPVILRAKLWQRTFGSLVEGIRKELEQFVPGLTEASVSADLNRGRFLTIIDGLDEVLQGGDVLYDDLLRLVRPGRARVVATCRKDNYGEELRGVFRSVTIDRLTDEQVEAYAARYLGSDDPGFKSRVGSTLWELVHSPLFLLMTVAVLKAHPRSRLPANRASLYSKYVAWLLTERHRRNRLPQAPVVDNGTKELLLARYARSTFRQSPDDATLTVVCQQLASSWSPSVVRDELFRTGLLRPQQGGPEFYHPSLQEYFAALDISRQPDHDLLAFLELHQRDERYTEVFVFLSGLLRDQERQALFLDYLEEHNLLLYRRCLESRFDRSEEIQREWPEGYVRDYLGQVRTSYVRVVDAHFRAVKGYLRPWLNDLGTEGIEDWDLAIHGGIEPSIPTLNYQFTPSAPTSPPESLVTVTAPGGRSQMRVVTPEGDRVLSSFSSVMWSHGPTFYDLSQTDLGIDSAREVAFDKLKHEVATVLKERMYYEHGNLILAGEYVEAVLRNLSKSATQENLLYEEPVFPDEFAGLSLRTMSVDQVLDAIAFR